MMTRSFSFVLAMIALALCAGCCTFAVWEETGKITTHIENIRTDFSRPDFLTVHFYGKQEKTYLPWIPDCSPEPWEQHITVPLNHYPDESIGAPRNRTFVLRKTVSLSADEQGAPFRFYKTKCGLWSAPGSFSSELHPDDIPHLSDPFIDSGRLFIPFRVLKEYDSLNKRQKFCVYGYSVTQASFPLDGIHVEPMKGTGISILRWSLIPVPVVLDLACFPFSLTGGILLLPVIIWTGYGTCEEKPMFYQSAWWETDCIEPLNAEKGQKECREKAQVSR